MLVGTHKLLLKMFKRTELKKNGNDLMFLKDSLEYLRDKKDNVKFKNNPILYSYLMLLEYIMKEISLKNGGLKMDYIENIENKLSKYCSLKKAEEKIVNIVNNFLEEFKKTNRNKKDVINCYKKMFGLELIEKIYGGNKLL